MKNMHCKSSQRHGLKIYILSSSVHSYSARQCSEALRINSFYGYNNIPSLEMFILGTNIIHICSQALIKCQLGFKKYLMCLIQTRIHDSHCTKNEVFHFSKCDQIRGKLRICSHLLKKSLMEDFIFCAVSSKHLK